MGRNQKVICSSCKETMRSDNLKRHLKACKPHRITKRTTFCPVCLKLISLGNMRIHVRIRHPEQSHRRMKAIRKKASVVWNKDIVPRPNPYSTNACFLFALMLVMWRKKLEVTEGSLYRYMPGAMALVNVESTRYFNYRDLLMELRCYCFVEFWRPKPKPKTKT